MAEEKKKVETKTIEVKEPKVIVSEPIKTLFVDGFHGVAITNGSIRINLYEEKFDPISEEVTRYVVRRLAMPVDAFLSFSQVLWQIRETLVPNSQQEGGKEDGNN